MKETLEILKRHAGSIVVVVLVLYGILWISRKSDKVPTLFG